MSAVVDRLGVEVALGDVVYVLAWGSPIRLADTGRRAPVVGFTPGGRVKVDASAYPDGIAAGRALDPLCLAVLRRDGEPGYQGNA